MVGSAILRKLTELGYTNIITATKKELDLILKTLSKKALKKLGKELNHA